MSSLLAGFSFFSAPAYAGAEKPPNIILILLDDMGYGDLSVTGAQGYLTPNIDRLAKEGMLFSQFYAAQPVSSASRAGILTGCYPNRLGFAGALMPQDTIGIRSEEILLPEVLKTKGYHCGAIGKWHVGHQYNFLPLQNGFDEYFGLPYSNDMWPVDFDGHPVTEKSGLAHKMNYPRLSLMEGNELVQEICTLEDQATLTTLYTERAVSFIQENSGKPFFLYLAHSMPHVPLAVSDKFKNKSDRGLYGDVMMEIDWSLQLIMQTLEERGVEDNTLVIFTSDNGPWLTFGAHGGSAAGLREGKLTTFEGGQRVPCIMWWKNRIPQGVVCNKLVSAIDIFPTLASITRSTRPSRRIDGVDILPLLKGDNDIVPRKDFWYYYGKNNLEAVRNERFKLVFSHTYMANVEPGSKGHKGKSVKTIAKLALYDLMTDPGERYNVVDKYPEEVTRLQVVAEQVRNDLGDDLNRE